MDFKSRHILSCVWLALFLVCRCAAQLKDGHFKCTWHTVDKTSSLSGTTQTSDLNVGKLSSCTVADTLRLSSYINYCTRQNYVPLLACMDNGEWNCESFLGICKTIIRSDPATSEIMSRTTMIPRKSFSNVPTEPKPIPQDDGRRPQVKEFNPNENYFTMKEMAIAVLVSFITGATVLALVIFVVWRWRNCHVDHENRREESRSSMKDMASLHALGQLVQAIGIGHDNHNHHKSFINPYYGQHVATRDILDDVINDQDRAYEEIGTRRKSSCKHADCVYATVDKCRVHPTIVRTKSGTELKTIDESVESDAGYDADINGTPQTPRRFIKYLTNAVYSVPRSPVFNDGPFKFEALDADALRHTLTLLRPDSVSSEKDLELATIRHTNDKQHTNDNIILKARDVDCNKSDSGYVDESLELNIDHDHHGKNVGEASKKVEHANYDDTERRPSLRL